MSGLTTLGIAHTAIAVVAVAAGAADLLRHRRIALSGGLGQLYFWATVLTCLTGFGIFQHGGFGKPHMLGIFTLLVLAAVQLGARTTALGRAAPYVTTLGLSFSFFLHWIPGLTETFTRVPVEAPLFSGPEDPALQQAVGLLFLVFLVGAALQWRMLRAELRGAAPLGAAAAR